MQNGEQMPTRLERLSAAACIVLGTFFAGYASYDTMTNQPEVGEVQETVISPRGTEVVVSVVTPAEVEDAKTSAQFHRAIGLGLMILGARLGRHGAEGLQLVNSHALPKGAKGRYATFWHLLRKGVA